MNKVLAYVLPVRLFHTLFALLFVFSFSVGKWVDDDSVLYVYHMISGIIMAGLVAFRLVWGLVGARTSRFSSFLLNPVHLIKYFKNVLSGSTERVLGHNPASSWAAIVMFVLTILLVASGLFYSNGLGGELFEEIHELAANLFALTVLLHIGGVVMHQFQHKDGMATSMVSGEKAEVRGQSPIGSSHRGGAVIFIIFVMLLGYNIFANFDSQTSQLNFWGGSIQLGENEQDESNEQENESASEKDHDDDDDDDDDD